ncbi:MAG: hypothetical protein NC079_05310 [Clostridium sp.]|nr:hypothetical protein [Acetatifactor muris]MCM1526788.1 hypothetical protein [Bacteroides sp.]MCM1563011.1 hypothetical protein [Clostridium sp.]
MEKRESEVHIMPSVELMECEKIAYISGMKEYLQKLKSMEQSQAQRISLENLRQSKIIGENGEFTEHYGFMRTSTQKR